VSALPPLTSCKKKVRPFTIRSEIGAEPSDAPETNSAPMDSISRCGEREYGDCHAGAAERGVLMPRDVIHDHGTTCDYYRRASRAAAFEPTTFPVLSVYLNTQPDQHGRTPDAAPYLHREFKALARTWAPSSPEHHSFDQDVERSFPI
jgi:hypothetical protein